METPILPAAILAEKKSNWPFLLRFAIFLAGLFLLFEGHLLIGALVFLVGIITLFVWSGKSLKQNEALLLSLSQQELISMIGRDAQTWRSTDSVVRELDRRFPIWRKTS